MVEISYCIKCKEKKEIKDTQIVILKNKMRALKGVCCVCGTTISRMLSKEGQSEEKVALPEQEIAQTAINNRDTTICSKIGKLAGAITKRVSLICERINKIGASTYKEAQKILKKGTQTIKDNLILRKEPNRESELRLCEEKQRQFFVQLGTEVFSLKKKQIEDILNQPNIQELTKQLDETQQHIQELKKILETGRVENEKQTVFNQVITNLRNKDPQVRLTAINALEKSGKKGVISYLSKLLEDSDEKVRTQAALAINKLAQITPDITPVLTEGSDLSGNPEGARDESPEKQPDTSTDSYLKTPQGLGIVGSNLIPPEVYPPNEEKQNGLIIKKRRKSPKPKQGILPPLAEEENRPEPKAEPGAGSGPEPGVAPA